MLPPDALDRLLDTRKLSYLAAVIDYGSFRNASRHLDVSQPALSKSILRLENELGVKLLERGGAGVTTTAMGEILYSHAKSIFGELKSATTRLRPEAVQQPEVITLGTLPALASFIVPLALGRCAAMRQVAEVRIVETGQAELLLGLMKGEFDFIIGPTRYCGRVEGLKQRVLFRDRKRVCARAGHPLQAKTELTWPDLTAYPWVCPMAGPLKTVLETTLAASGHAPPEHITRVGSVEFARTLIANSDYLTILPPHAVAADLREGRLVTLPITIPHPGRDVALIFRELSPPDTSRQSLIACIEDAGTELGDPADTSIC